MKTVLFVCVENSNRSQMAEAFARMHGGGEVQAASAGSRPSGRITPKAIEAMRELGYDLTGHASKGLESVNGTAVDVAVTMGCGDDCPLVCAGPARGLADPRPPGDVARGLSRRQGFDRDEGAGPAGLPRGLLLKG